MVAGLLEEVTGVRIGRNVFQPFIKKSMRNDCEFGFTG
jgi:hypothetical protein